MLRIIERARGELQFAICRKFEQLSEMRQRIRVIENYMQVTPELIHHDNFTKIADVLLNKNVLAVKNKQFRLCEIEFYYRNKSHNDEYVHCDDDQLDFGGFYFHKYKTGSYKSGTYKGLDITFGDRKSETYFGILIRSMMDLETKEFTEGPCKCVNKILEQFGFETVADFMKDKPAKLTIGDKTHEFYLKEKSDLIEENMLQGPRAGLSQKYPDYLMKFYRYAIFANKIKKQKLKNNKSERFS